MTLAAAATQRWHIADLRCSHADWPKAINDIKQSNDNIKYSLYVLKSSMYKVRYKQNDFSQLPTTNVHPMISRLEVKYSFYDIR